MTLESIILSYLEPLTPYLSYLIITFAVWITYSYSLKCGFVSDDIAGIAEYDGSLYYPVDTESTDSKPTTQKNPDGSTKKALRLEYGTLWRWSRYWIVGGNFPSGKKAPDGKTDIPQGKSPIRHHFLSILIFNLTCLVTLIALKPILGEQIALLSILILIVHPCTTQGVAWISGLAYPMSLLWISVSIILMQFFYANPTMNNSMWVIPLFCVIQFFAIHAIFATTGMIWALLLFLGYWQFAILGFIVSFVMCFDQVRKTVTFRVQEFKKQHMEQSTVINIAKPVVMMKTFWYYCIHAVNPMRMGLYHEWGFHYEKDIERRDWMFWKGFLFFCLLTFIFIKTNVIGIQLGILWFVIFSVGFWNLITAQQFVTERYIMVANLGLGIIIATLTQNYLWVYALILGMYLVKTWDYLPTYDNELRFYQSNHWNFQKSEVAMGNLGVTYARVGLEDTARDTWAVATSLNPDYDVPWVNIFYQYRTKGFVMINNGDYVGGLRKLQEGLPYLGKALACKVCHFPEQWKKEYIELFNSISNPSRILQDELERLLRLKEILRNSLSSNHDSKRISEITESINNNENQMDRLITFFKSQGFKVSDPTPFNAYYTNKTIQKIGR